MINHNLVIKYFDRFIIENQQFTSVPEKILCKTIQL
jgi:hypothetical protein